MQDSSWSMVYVDYDIMLAGSSCQIIYNKIYLGESVEPCIPRPTWNTVKIGDIMYGGTDTVAYASYTANSTAKLGGTTAKNKGYFSISNPISYNSIYKTTATTLQPLSRKITFYIRY